MHFLQPPFDAKEKFLLLSGKVTLDMLSDYPEGDTDIF